MSQAVANLASAAKQESERAIKLAEDAQQAVASLAEEIRKLKEEAKKIGQVGARISNR